MGTPDGLRVLEALHSTPSRRYLAPDPIPDEVLWAILDAAIRGPSGSNRQGWAWVVVTDPAPKQVAARWCRERWRQVHGDRRYELATAPSDPDGMSARSFVAAQHLADTIENAPVWVVPVLLDAADTDNLRVGSWIYGAVQQLVLAARAYGIGTTLTTLFAAREAEFAQLLGLPANALIMGLLPLGYPARGRWAEPARRPVEQVVHWERYGSMRSR